MSPRVIQLPMSGRDRRHYAAELRKGEQAHRSLVERAREALEKAYDLACQEWNTRQFIGGDAAPSPVIEAAILAGRELLEVRCKRCGHESLVDLTEVIWPRQKQVHALAAALRCQRCKDERRKVQPDLVDAAPAFEPGSGGAGKTNSQSMTGQPPKITFREIRASGVRGVVIYCADFQCSHSTKATADGWDDELRLSDIEDRFVCQVCGRRGADIRPDFDWKLTPAKL